MSRSLASAAAQITPRDLVRTVPISQLGGMPIAALGMKETADLMVEIARSDPRPHMPVYLTSANGEVLSRHARDRDFSRIVALADLVSADGQPMVTASRLFGEHRLPERVATTDLFHDVARAAVMHGLTFYMFGAEEEENRRATENAQALYPELKIVGRSHGFHQGEALRAKLAEIDALAPDILWLALGVPREQSFVYEYGPLLTHVGVIKTSGGLFNFLSGSRARAPGWMQALSLEWLWRIKEEPTRLFWRYATTNPHAAYLLMTRSRTMHEKAGDLPTRLRRLRKRLVKAGLHKAPPVGETTD